MGKGGVGKTTTAAAIAVELAARGHEVLLSTTDPAAHVAEAIGGAVPHLRVTRIDPVAETRAYSEEVISAAAPTLDARGRDLLEEDLRSPCTEEIAVFRAFAQAVAQGEDAFVILDTAPTGHTLLLLDAAEAYHREVSRTQGAVPESVRQLLPRLRDPEFTKVLLITLPEATPVHEAAQLQEDLRRAGIEPFAWVVNQSFDDARITDPVLRERGAREHPYLTEVREQLAHRVAWVPWYPEPPSAAPTCSSSCAEVRCRRSRRWHRKGRCLDHVALGSARQVVADTPKPILLQRIGVAPECRTVDAASPLL